jgi:hypothetical protein
MLFSLVSILSVPTPVKHATTLQAATCQSTCDSCIATIPYNYDITGSAAVSAANLHSCTTSACSGCIDVYCDHDTIHMMNRKCNTTALAEGISNTPTSPYAPFWLSCALCNAPPIAVEQVIPPPAPPSAPVPPPPVHTMEGWCNNWNHGDWPADNTGSPFYGNVADQAECFGHCSANPYCQQAVFETGGQWGNECWLGTNAMVQTPRRARGSCHNNPTCSDTCFNKVGWPAAAP